MERMEIARGVGSKAAGATVSVVAFLDSVLVPRMSRYIPETPAESYLTGMMYRTISQLQSLAQLDRVAGLQLVVAGCRSLLEVVVDTVLVKHCEPKDAVDRIEAWELSSKLKHAEATLAYLDRAGEKPASAEAPLVDFIAKRKATIDEKRKQFWPSRNGRGKHPNRWTSNNLGQDLRTVDSLEGTNLERFYETEYRRMNWLVHGSGLTAFRGIDYIGFAVMFALAHKMSGQLALQVVRSFVGETEILGQDELLAFEDAENRWHEGVLEGMSLLESLRQT